MNQKYLKIKCETVGPGSYFVGGILKEYTGVQSDKKDGSLILWTLPKSDTCELELKLLIFTSKVISSCFT